MDQPNQDSLDILYQDDLLVAVNKPSGLLVHRSMIDRHETRFALQILRDQLDRHVFPLHRLDKPTSGVLLFALDAETARAMMPQFQENRVKKRYLALVRGYAEEIDTIDYALKEKLDKMTDRRAQKDKPAQDAVTSYRTLQRVELPIASKNHPTSRYSLLEVIPHAGRKHQIRRHMKHIFHPIVGDTTHGDGLHNRIFRDHFDCQRLMLMAQSMQIEHPYSGEPLSIEAKVDHDFRGVLNSIGLSWSE